MVKIQELFNRLGLMVQFSRMNLKLTGITLIGLTIGLSMLSAALFQLDTAKADFYITTLEEYKDTLDLGGHYQGYISATTIDTVTELKDAINVRISDQGLSKLFHRTNFYPYLSTSAFFYVNQSSSVVYWSIYGIDGLNASILTECTAGSRLPRNQSEVLVFVRNTTAPLISLHEQFNITSHHGEGIKSNITLTVVGLLTSSTLVNPILQEINEYNEDYYVLTNLNFSCGLVQTLMELSDLVGYDAHFRGSVYFHFTFDFTALTKDNVIEVTERILSLSDSLESGGHPDYGGLHGNFYLAIRNLEWILVKFYNLYIWFLLITLPVFIIVALLGNFSLGIINERRQKALELVKIRGVSNRFVFLGLLLETLVLTVVGAFLGLVIGIPLSLVLSASTGLLVFTHPLEPSKLVVTLQAIQWVFLTSGLMVFLFHLPSVVRLSRSTIGSLSEEGELTSSRKMRITLGKLDVELLGLGVAGIVVMAVLVEGFRQNPTNQTVIDALFGYYYILGIISLLLVFFGSLSTLNRFIPKVLQKLGKMAWRRDWRSVAIAARNLSASPHVTTRTSLLIAVSLALLVMFSLFTLSYHYQSVDNAFYTVGSEVSYSNPFNNEFNAIVAELPNVTGFAYTIVKEYQVHPKAGSAVRYIMGIEPNFASIAHWQSYYADEPLESLVTTLFTSNVNNSAIVDTFTLTRDQLTLGSSLRLYDSNGEVTIPLSIQAVTTYWPRLTKWTSQDSFFITRADYLANVTSSSTDTLLGKILPGYDKAHVISTINQIIHNKVRSFHPDRLDVVYEYDALREGSILNTFLWFTVNTNIITGLVIILSTLALFTISRTFRHAQELALSRSLGMRFPQVFLLLFTEPFLVFGLSGIPGGLLGGLLVLGLITMNAHFFVQGAPWILQIDVPLLMGYYALIFLTSVVVGFGISLMASRINISKILKAE
ncbi:MAG: FtsX-like permease family protein [Candidatus Hermodarchaeota archaeon]